MGYASGWRHTGGPQAGEWFLNAYYYSFDATGVDAIDELLSAVAYAGKRYHGTDMWTEPTEDEDGKPGPSSVDEIQMAAQRAAAQLAEARAEIERLHSRWSTGLVQEQAARIAELEAECEALRADVVFSVRDRIYDGRSMGRRIMLERETGDKIHRDATCDSDILRAVREARNGVS